MSYDWNQVPAKLAELHQEAIERLVVEDDALSAAFTRGRIHCLRELIRLPQTYLEEQEIEQQRRDHDDDDDPYPD